MLDVQNEALGQHYELEACREQLECVRGLVVAVPNEPLVVSNGLVVVLAHDDVRLPHVVVLDAVRLACRLPCRVVRWPMCQLGLVEVYRWQA